MNDNSPFVRDDVRGFLDFLASMERPELDQQPLAEARAGMVAMAPVIDLPPRELPVIRDLTCPGPAGDIPLRFYDTRTDRDAACPLMLFFHGGGFVIGNLDSHHALCTELAAGMDLPVLAVDYRLAPEHPFPAAPEDCEAAARWAAKSPHELGIKVSGLIPIGDSAGGNLTIVTTQSLAEKEAMVPVVLQVPLYPMADALEQHASYSEFGEGFFLSARAMDFFGDAYRGDAQDRRTYPILGRHEGTPPTVVMTAGLDPLRDSGRNYAAHLIHAGTDVIYLEMRGSIHGWVNMRKAIPSTGKDLADIIAAMKLMLARHG
ncbi:MAG TPA: alpha/beta hydrolase [Croceibacterium sp.]|nr:alpha/beta hydrolase [Croceibacterium sp.]